jgi:1-acyl-sn-glycerol-3-phosphate acyltransferase
MPPFSGDHYVEIGNTRRQRQAASLSSGRHMTSTGVDMGTESKQNETPATAAAGPDGSTSPRLLDWVFTVPFLIAFGLSLAVFDPIQRLARLFGSRPHEIVVGCLQVLLVGALRICGTRFQVERSPEVAPRTPYLIIANHQSMFDIPIVMAFLFTNYPKFVSKRELARWIPSVSYNLRRGGNALIDRGNRREALGAIRALGKLVQKRGVSAVIYPEGTGAIALLDAAPALAVVPMAIDESWRLLRYNLFPVPFGVRVRVHFGAPICREGAGDARSVLVRAQVEIEHALRRWRAVDSCS